MTDPVVEKVEEQIIEVKDDLKEDPGNPALEKRLGDLEAKLDRLVASVDKIGATPIAPAPAPAPAPTPAPAPEVKPAEEKAPPKKRRVSAWFGDTDD